MIKRYQRTAFSQYILVGLILIALVILGFLSTLAMKQIPFEDHFALSWSAGRAWLLEGMNPYEIDLAKIAGDAIEDAGYQARLPAQTMFSQPLINLFFTLPFSLIPYGISRAVWLALLVVVLALIIYFSLHFSEWQLSRLERVFVFVLLILWFPGVFAVFTGQLSLVFILLSLLGMVFLKSGRFQAAGFILALTAGALPMVVPVLIFAILWSISKKEWSFLAAFFSGIAFLVVVSLLMLPGWPLDWLSQMLQIYQGFSWVETPLITLASLLPGVSDFLAIALHAGFGIYLLAIWINLFRKSERVFMWSALAVFVISNLFHIQYDVPGLYMLIPALCLVFRFSFDRWGLIGKVLSWIFLVLVSIGSWLLILPDISFFRALSIPLLTVGLPLLVFSGMFWIRWWAVKLTRLPDY